MQKKVGVEEFKQLFREIGLDEKQMKKWHTLFEARHPESHQSFLEWLGLPAAQIARIRSECK
jgi:hypothetical protein